MSGAVLSLTGGNSLLNTHDNLHDNLFARADHYWASLLGCRTEQVAGSQTWIGENQTGTMLTALWRAGAWKIVFPQSVSEADRTRLVHHLADFAETVDPLPRNARQSQVAYLTLRDTLMQLQADTNKALHECVWGPAELLYFDPDQANLASTIEHRPLTQADSEQVALFRSAMIADGQQMVWSADDLPNLTISTWMDNDWPRMIGVFDQDQLVAVSAVRNWANAIGEVFTDILPAYRSQGIGTRISSDLIRWMLENTTLLLQSDADWMNVPSRHISRQLGFKFYGMLIMSDISA